MPCVDSVVARQIDLSDKTALVTGSSQGIGLAIARGLDGAGARVILIGRDAGKLERAAADIGGALTVAADITSDDGWPL
jgi:gluconate 5-dehydrogenase